MAIFSRTPKRQVPAPQTPVSHRSDNPLFTPPDRPTPSPQVQIFRQRVITWFAGALTVSLLGLAVYGPWLRITSITIAGTKALDPKSVEQVTNQFLNQRRWGILPNRNLWVLSGGWLAHQLQARINQRLSIEQVVIDKQYPRGLTITIHERIAVARWVSGGQTALVDRHGVVMNVLTAGQTTLPLVVDQAQPTLVIDQPIVTPEVVSAVTDLNSALTIRQVKFTQFLIPVPTCPAVQPPAPSLTFNANSAQVNSDLLNLNTGSLNLNTEPLTNLNTNIEVCDLAKIHFSSQEVHLQLEHGPRVYFDRHQDLNQAVDSLVRVLTHQTTPITQYIDLRFGDRVYVK